MKKHPIAFTISVISFGLWLAFFGDYVVTNGVGTLNLLVNPTSSNELRFMVVRLPICFFIASATFLFSAIALAKDKFIIAARALNYLILVLLLIELIYVRSGEYTYTKKLMNLELLLSNFFFVIPCLINLSAIGKKSIST